MIITVDDSTLRDVLSDVIENLDYDIWKVYFLPNDDEDDPDYEAGLVADLSGLCDVFRQSLLRHNRQA